MTTSQKPILHGRDHAVGGADEIPGIGAGGGGAKKLLVCWGGSLPTITTTGLVWRVPYDSDGSTLTFSLARAFARIESTSTGSVQFRIEKSSGGSVFTPTTVTTLTIAAASYEVEDTSLGGTVASGQLVRLVFVAVAATPVGFSVELLGTE